MADELARKIIDYTEQLFSTTERSNQEDQWRTQSRYLLTEQSGNFNEVPVMGEKKTSDVYDSEGRQANRDFSNIMKDITVPISSRWSKLEFEDEELNDDEDSVEWLEDSAKRMHKALSDSNLDAEVGRDIRQENALGSSVLFHDTLPKGRDGRFSGFNFQTWHIGDVCWEDNELGVADSLYRKFTAKTKKVIEMFKQDTPSEVMEWQDKNPDKDWELYHTIRKRDPSKVKDGLIVSAGKMPFESIYVLKNPCKVIQESGYMEFPAHISRFDTFPGGVYGYGPGHIAINDVRSLNKFVELGFTSFGRAAGPPIFSERRNILSSLRLAPNELTIVRDINKIREFTTQANFPAYEFYYQHMVEKIRRAYFLDKLMLPPRTETGEMSAFEVSQRLEQAQKVVGTPINRRMNEANKPLVIRAFKTMLRDGAFAQMPPEVRRKGLNIRIAFLNQFNRQQRIEEVNAINQWMLWVSNVSQFRPDAVDNVNIDIASKIVARGYGVPELAIENDDKVVEKRKQRAEAEQAQQQAELAVQMGDAAVKASQVQGQ